MMNFQQTAIETLGEEPQFDIADVVQLVSGGPPMTVTGWKGVMIHCEWFVRTPDGKSWLPDLYEADIHVDCLMVAKGYGRG
jgi:uncharacterized protein YodC (DUF2158 family)